MKSMLCYLVICADQDAPENPTAVIAVFGSKELAEEFAARRTFGVAIVERNLHLSQPDQETWGFVK